MADYVAVCLSDERNCKLAVSAQRIDDVLLGVAGMGGIPERRRRQRFDRN
jgi:hypothetical protein